MSRIRREELERLSLDQLEALNLRLRATRTNPRILRQHRPQQPRQVENVQSKLDELIVLYKANVEAGLKEEDRAPFRVELIRIYLDETLLFQRLEALISTIITEHQQRIDDDLIDDTDMAEEQIRVLKDLKYQMDVVREFWLGFADSFEDIEWGDDDDDGNLGGGKRRKNKKRKQKRKSTKKSRKQKGGKKSKNNSKRKNKRKTKRKSKRKSRK